MGLSLKKLGRQFMSMATLGLNGGGGGGGNPADDQASAQARLRAQQDKAIAALNRAFGLYDPASEIAFDPNASADGGTLAKRLKPVAGAPMSYMRNGKLVFTDRNAYDAELARRTAERDGVQAKRQAFYRTAGDDILNAKTPQLQKQRDTAARKLKFALARNSQVGGSVALDQGRELTDNYQRGMLDLNNERNRAINTMRASDEENRINLIGQIRAGMDQNTALQAAQARTTAAINGARDSALGQTVQDYFAGMTYLNQQAQQQQGYNDRMNQLRGILPAANNGTITRT